MIITVQNIEDLYHQYDMQALNIKLKCESHSDGHLDGSGTHNGHIDEHSDRPND